MCTLLRDARKLISYAAPHLSGFPHRVVFVVGDRPRLNAVPTIHVQAWYVNRHASRSLAGFGGLLPRPLRGRESTFILYMKCGDWRYSCGPEVQSDCVLRVGLSRENRKKKIEKPGGGRTVTHKRTVANSMTPVSERTLRDAFRGCCQRLFLGSWMFLTKKEV